MCLISLHVQKTKKVYQQLVIGITGLDNVRNLSTFNYVLRKCDKIVFSSSMRCVYKCRIPSFVSAIIYVNNLQQSEMW